MCQNIHSATTALDVETCGVLQWGLGQGSEQKIFLTKPSLHEAAETGLGISLLTKVIRQKMFYAAALLGNVMVRRTYSGDHQVFTNLWLYGKAWKKCRSTVRFSAQQL